MCVPPDRFDTVTEAIAVVAPFAARFWVVPIWTLALLASKKANVPGVGGLVPVVAVTVAVIVTGLPKFAGPPVGTLTVSATGTPPEVTFWPGDGEEAVKFALPEYTAQIV